jgi:CheY-like chemotaxis protein
MTLKFGGTSVNLSKVGFLVADPSELYRHLFRRLLFGFGARKVHEAATVRDARLMLAKHHVDFLICAADLPGNGIEFTRSLRLAADNPQRTIPIIITMGTARRITVAMARDSGANFVLSKPISPLVLYDRLTWIARQPRPFWESETYFGPDRRFRALRHKGMPKRRAGDEDEINIEDDHAA